MAMSVRDIVELPPGTHPHAARIVTGFVDVFAIDDQHRPVPIGTVGVGAVVPAARSHVHLRVVPRLDSTCEAVPDAHYADEASGVSAFAASLIDRLGSRASPLQDIKPEHMPAALADALIAFLGALSSEEGERRARRVSIDTADRRAEYHRLAENITAARVVLPPASDDPLTSALRRVGDFGGFTVSQPLHPRADLRYVNRLPGLAHASGVRYRRVRLDEGWDRYKSSAFLAFLNDDECTPVALVPSSAGYVAFRGGALVDERVTDDLLAQAGATAYEFTAPLDRTRAASWRDMVRVSMARTGGSWAIITGMAALIAVLGLLTPILTQFVLGVAVSEGSVPLIAQAGVALVVVALGSGIFSMVMYFTISRVTQEATARVQPALWDRLLSMPASFFRDYSSGDLSVRVMAANALQQLVSAQVVGAVLAAAFSLVNLVLMFWYSLTLGLIGLVFILLTFAILAYAVRVQQRLYTDSIYAQLEGTSWVVQLLTGIAKVRMAGADERLELPYLDQVRRQMVALARMTLTSGRVNAWFLLVAPLATGLFFLAIVGGVGDTSTSISAPTFLAFTASFSIVFGAINGLIAVLSPIASAGPILRLLHPILTGLPESASHRADPGPMSGAIELRNVVFRYQPDAPIVLDRLSLRVAAGEMVALVGPSGSGKSTVVRLMLGFESPEDGQILIDGRDLSALDLDLVRSQMGVVIQNGQLTRASVLNNILGVAGGAESEAWRAAEAANLADDIRDMPMKMQTIVDPTLVSGGQAQRILLARAMVRSPKVILLDEATSSLDNESQERVSEALDALGATRIVVAHRLSTIRNADRIVVVVAGRVVQQGTYDELIAQSGEFADLVKRQIA